MDFQEICIHTGKFTGQNFCLFSLKSAYRTWSKKAIVYENTEVCFFQTLWKTDSARLQVLFKGLEKKKKDVKN